jgi:predicted RNase H-like HicB family nuclease
MKPSNLVLRGFAERDEDGSWFAICLELNLYARGDSFEEAKDKLQRLIRTYLSEAVNEDADYVDDLVPRRAPLYFWLRYATIWCLSRLHQARQQGRRFKIPLPMVPA